jgi:hypothetical protein
VASLVGWKSRPILFYQIYCMITRPTVETAEGRVGAGNGKVRGSRARGTNGICVFGRRGERVRDRTGARGSRRGMARKLESFAVTVPQKVGRSLGNVEGCTTRLLPVNSVIRRDAKTRLDQNLEWTNLLRTGAACARQWRAQGGTEFAWSSLEVQSIVVV